jgi:hypothetical protein
MSRNVSRIEQIVKRRPFQRCGDGIKECETNVEWCRMSMRKRVIVIQAMIVAALILWLKVGLPRIEEARAAAEAARREQRIESFVESVVVEGGSSSDETPAGEPAPGAHPQRLRLTPHVTEVKKALGAPDSAMTDFRGGQHLTWTGTRRKLVGSFHQGRLYALTLEDLHTDRGVRVYESSAQWQRY